MKSAFVACCVASVLSLSVFAGEPTYVQGKDIFIETGVEAPDRSPTWYAPMVNKPSAPAFEILATRGTEGRYYPYTYTVNLKDMIKWHGHDCEGTIHAANAAKIAFGLLFPDSIIDRSVLGGISGTGACWSDAVAFLTGARFQYGNLGFFKSKDYGHAILLYRQDTGMAVLATWKKGINNIRGSGHEHEVDAAHGHRVEEFREPRQADRGAQALKQWTRIISS